MKVKNIFMALAAVLIIAAGLTFFPMGDVQAMHGNNVVIVLDPGHGGTEEGAKYAPYLEKDMTLYTAACLYRELLQYKGVEVYFTRVDDRDMTLAQRVDYAHSLGADFLISLHFNAKGMEGMDNGSLVLVSAFGNMNIQGSELGTLCLNQLSDLGYKNNGLITRIGNTGQDYYGIIRRSTAYGMPSVIIEHCFLDNEKDRQLLSKSQSMEALAHADAVGIAQYFGLKKATR